MNVSFKDLLTECERLGINGLLFQHIRLCPTRTWLHYHLSSHEHATIAQLRFYLAVVEQAMGQPWRGIPASPAGGGPCSQR